MKRLSLYILFLSVLVAGCEKKTDELFEKSVDERIKESLDAYQAALVAAPGWKLFVYTQGLRGQDIEVGGLTYYVKFGENNLVTMVSEAIEFIKAIDSILMLNGRAATAFFAEL